MSTPPLAEAIVFVHGMANFAHNRGTKADQERLLRDRLDQRHGLRGVFDDSGNYAFLTVLGLSALRTGVLTALRSKYEVAGAVVVPRATCAAGLKTLEQIAVDRYGSRFRNTDYAVTLASGLWRLGLVFMDSRSGIEPRASMRLRQHHDARLAILTVHDLMVGVLKYDEGKRIPWGVPAGFIERALSDTDHALLATGRSARTVRGTLRPCSQDYRARPLA